MGLGSAGSPPPSGPQIKALLAAIGLNCVELFTAATLPSAGQLGRVALLTDSPVPLLVFDDGGAWQPSATPPKFASLTAVNTKASLHPAVRAFNAATFR